MEKAKHIQVIQQGVIDIQKRTILCSLSDTKWTFPWSHSVIQNRKISHPKIMLQESYFQKWLIQCYHPCAAPSHHQRIYWPQGFHHIWVRRWKPQTNFQLELRSSPLKHRDSQAELKEPTWTVTSFFCIAYHNVSLLKWRATKCWR